MQNSINLSRRSLLTKAAIGLPAMGVIGALSWANPAATPEASALTVDGVWGPETTRALQGYLKTPVDGIVSGQDPTWRRGNTHLGWGWDWSNSGGSALIRAIQRRLGVTADGYFGPQTSRAWHSRMGRVVSNYFNHPGIVRDIQTRLNQGRDPFRAHSSGPV
ncbi:peptidoglycan-binding protein [Arachnia propionica]|uniref:Peptidoglycan-binding protein n=1 Tax=Arachnia propionica TaxID=1750 RepID=A0A3P1T647_9ACTN|nr:peptidoglycan-binding protein [Arachnia propionica]MDO5083905.1 peptidoglycan-binding protein [Arachnia propionica]RRD04675.1 peptidoglycan-binding protein [Arachnia propionica]